jgi:hypothetical protein
MQERDIRIAEYEDIIETDKLTIKNLNEELTSKNEELIELNKLYG